MSAPKSDALLLVSTLGLATALVCRFPVQAAETIKFLSACADAAKKRQQADNDLLGNLRLAGGDGCPSKAAHRYHYNDQRCAGDGLTARKSIFGNCLSARHAVFRRLDVFCLGDAPGFDSWGKLLRQGRDECGDHFFVVRGHGFGLVVKNTILGRVVGRIGVAHAGAFSRFELWKANRKGLPA